MGTLPAYNEKYSHYDPCVAEQIAIDWSNPSTIFAIGEGPSGYDASCVFKSADNGKSFSLVKISSMYNSIYSIRPSIFFDESSYNKIYAATSGSVLQSNDRGASFKFTAGKDNYAWTTSLSINHSKPSHLCYTAFGGSFSTSSIMCTTDRFSTTFSAQSPTISDRISSGEFANGPYERLL